MRRSFRDAIVGLSLIGGIAVFSGSILWLRGFKLQANSWEVTADLLDASGLAVMSPVTYRGINIGSIKKINFTPKSVEAIIQINYKNLLLSKPVYAKIITSSVLGGDAQLTLISEGQSNDSRKFNPKSKNCDSLNNLCDGDVIQGQSLKSLSTLTEGFEAMLSQAEEEKIVLGLSKSMRQFDNTQKNLDELIYQSKSELTRAQPIITQLIEASSHLNNILAAINNPKTINEIKEISTTSNSIAKKLDRLGADIEEVIDDKELMDALREITIGLSKLFNELYP